MALSRALLKGMSLSEEQVQAIIDAHRETVDALKDERDQYKADAEKLPEIQKELEGLKKDGGGWQKKYEDEHKAFDEYKKEVETKESVAKVKEAYRKLLKDEKVADKHLDAVLKVTDFSALKLKDDGTLEGADELKKTIKSEWADFIVTTNDKGTDVETPPDDKGKGSFPTGRAAELAKQYHENLYGATPEKKE